MTAHKMVEIAAGSFRMGTGNHADETPAHTVSLDGFVIDATEVTQADYRALMGVNPAHFQGDDQRPVENVTWYDAVLYCIARSERDGLEPVYRHRGVVGGRAGDGCTGLTELETALGKNGYRLPFEAEWEYAMRAGTVTEYYWGDVIDDDYAWWQRNSAGTTHAVGAKKPNAWGLYDMSGNVWEWCGDWMGKTYYATSPGKSPKGPDSGPTRVVRGGSWNDVKDHHLRSAARGDLLPDNRGRYYGFRCVAGR
jgi:formylglycine-generating enzyme required for sulfatase activity